MTIPIASTTMTAASPQLALRRKTKRLANASNRLAKVIMMSASFLTSFDFWNISGIHPGLCSAYIMPYYLECRKCRAKMTDISSGRRTLRNCTFPISFRKYCFCKASLAKNQLWQTATRTCCEGHFMSVVRTTVAIEPELPDHAIASVAKVPAREKTSSALTLADRKFGLGEVVPGYTDQKSGC
jgi:hypothetical protein